MSKNNKVVCVLGPTASGKTELSLKIAENFGGDIICADSMQIYKDISIASAAPTEEEKARATHRLFEFLDPDTNFSTADYCGLARKEIDDCLKFNRLPVLTGGTGLYISSLADNIMFGEEEKDDNIRIILEARLEKEGAEPLFCELKRIDPKAAGKLHINNTRRIIRYLEIYYKTGRTATYLNEISKSIPSPYDFIMIGIKFADRAKLYERIEKRAEIMLNCGLLQEAKLAYEDKNSSKTSIQAIGHKEFFPYFKGEESLESCIEKFKTSTRHYAKRQLSWFNRDSRINWIYADTEPDIYKKAEQILECNGVKKP